MTIWDLLLPWRNIPALKHFRKTIKKLKRERNVAQTALAHSRRSLDKAHNEIVGLRAHRNVGMAEIEALEREKAGLKTELLQTKRAGYGDLAKDLGVSVEDIMDGKIEPMLHEDPQAVYRALDNAQASEVKFRLVKVVNRELRLVIRNIIDGLYRTKLTDEGRMFLELAEPYAVPRFMADKRKVLRLNYPKGKDDEAQAQAETKA